MKSIDEKLIPAINFNSAVSEKKNKKLKKVFIKTENPVKHMNRDGWRKSISPFDFLKEKRKKKKDVKKKKKQN